jgi:uncharacterized protein YnzC (UPF0291/DUF896 family)
MQNKLKRFSYNQLLVIRVFLQNAGKVVTLSQLEKQTKLQGKSLGGVISSLTRTKFRNIPLIDPMGQDTTSSGLRWILNDHLLNVSKALIEINRLLSLYE